MFYIYKITNKINGKIYIGKTSNIEERWKERLYISNKKSQGYFYLHKSINKYGVENFSIEKIETIENEEISLEREKFWIKELNSTNSKIGMNLTNGGQGTSGIKWTQESRDKITGINNHNYGKEISPEVKNKISYALYGDNNPFFGKKHSEEFVNFLKNRNVPEELCKIISEGCRGENQWNAKFTDQDVIFIRKLWKEGNLSQTEISKLYNVKPNTINQIVNNKRWTHLL